MATAKTETMKIQIDDLVREATAEEIAEIQAQRAESLAIAAEIEAKATARASALAKLAELGLTQEEIAAL
jgi:hypothetical protein